MYSIFLGLCCVYCIRFSASLASTEQFIIVSRHILPGWGLEVTNINRIECLLICSRKAYCWSVNYSNGNRICLVNKMRHNESVADLLPNSSYDYIEKVAGDAELIKHGIYFVSAEVDYENAMKICSDHFGSIATYEQLYYAFQPILDDCKEGWLVSGEIAFTELTDRCLLRTAAKRSNVFPCKAYVSGIYCHREYNQSPVTYDYLPQSQRIIRLTGNNSKSLNGDDAIVCCNNTFNGRLATPQEVKTNSLLTGVDLCAEGWLLALLAGNPCKGPSDVWLYPAGNHIFLKINTLEYPAFCFVPLLNQTVTYIDPFPAHRVILGQGESRYSLNYYEGEAFCSSRGGRMSSWTELENAWLSGYHSCNYGWVTSGNLLYPIVIPSRCTSWGDPRIGNFGLVDKATYLSGVYCYIP